MILTNLKNFDRYVSLHPQFAAVKKALETTDFLSLELGRFEIDGDNLFINNVQPTCVSEETQPLEMHVDYIDIHVLLEGKETIGYKATEEVEVYSQDYDKEGYCALTKEAATSVVNLLPGDMCIVYPEDAHAPIIGEGEIRKLIVKVKL